MNLDDALRTAARVHPSVLSKRAEVRAARSELAGANWQRFPSAGVLSSSDERGNAVTVARLQQPLWTGGRITATIAAAEARLRGSQAELAGARLDIQVRTASAYAELLRARNRLEAADRNVAEHRRLSEMIQRRVENEVTSASDATMASARLQQALSERIQFQTQAANAAAALAQMIMRPVNAADLVAPALPPIGFASLDEAQSAALAHAPALTRAQAEEAAAQATAEARRGTLFPQLIARYDHRFGGVFPSQGQAQIAIEYQPGAGLSAASAVDTSRARVEGARAGAELARLDLLDRVRTDWNEAASLSTQLGPLRSVKGATEDVADSFVRQYAVGRKTWIEVLNAQREATQARYALADAEASQLLALVRLGLYTGRLNAAGPPAAADATDTADSED